MLANFLLFLTVCIIGVTLLDFCMSDDQKKGLNNAVVRTWNWLDQAKRLSLLKMARTQRSKRTLFGMAIGSIILPYVALIPKYGSMIWGSFSPVNHLQMTLPYPEYYIKPAMLLITLIIIILVGGWEIWMIFRGRTALQIFSRTGVVLVLLLLVSEALFDLLLKVDQKHLTELLGIWAADIILYAMVVPASVALGLGSFWAASAGLTAAIYVGSLLLYIGELTLPRIAEYPKGPVLAVGMLLGLAGAAIKVLPEALR